MEAKCCKNIVKAHFCSSQITIWFCAGIDDLSAYFFTREHVSAKLHFAESALAKGFPEDVVTDRVCIAAAST